MRVPARCNKRACQARRNLSKPPEAYPNWPKCHCAGCDGLMYVDKYRLNKLEAKQRPVCYDDCYIHPHRVDSPNCKQRTEFILDKSMNPVSKHSPVRNEESF